MTQADDRIPGALTTADMAILGSPMPWTKHESDTGAIAWVSGAYRILSEGDNPRYWTATVRLDRDRQPIASAAGDLGLAKCVRYCERHSQGVGAEAEGKTTVRKDALAPIAGSAAVKPIGEQPEAAHGDGCLSTAANALPSKKDLSFQQKQLL